MNNIVFVLSASGWVSHGPVRASERQARDVARQLAKRLDWTTEVGTRAPAVPHPLPSELPSPALAALSPVWRDPELAARVERFLSGRTHRGIDVWVRRLRCVRLFHSWSDCICWHRRPARSGAIRRLIRSISRRSIHRSVWKCWTGAEAAGPWCCLPAISARTSTTISRRSSRHRSSTCTASPDEGLARPTNRPPDIPSSGRRPTRSYAFGRAMVSRWERDLLAAVPAARIVELRNANLYMFLSNEADILREVQAFGGTLSR